ncbi:23107_t:CDS:2, partial [Gigaspora rosea]
FPRSPNDNQEDIREILPQATTITTTNPHLSHINNLNNMYIEQQQPQIQQYITEKDLEKREAYAKAREYLEDKTGYISSEPLNNPNPWWEDVENECYKWCKYCDEVEKLSTTDGSKLTKEWKMEKIECSICSTKKWIKHHSKGQLCPKFKKQIWNN